jgi:hypothetical protein
MRFIAKRSPSPSPAIRTVRYQKPPASGRLARARSVPHGRDVLDVVKDAVVLVDQGVHDELDGHLVVRALLGNLEVFPAGNLVHDEGTAHRDPLHAAGGLGLFLVPVVKPVF